MPPLTPTTLTTPTLVQPRTATAAVPRQIRALELTAVLLAAEPSSRVPPEGQQSKTPIVLKDMYWSLKTDPGPQPNLTVRS